MRKDIKNRVRACEKYQRAKVFKHTKAPLSTFALPDARFTHIHIDYIGPYPPSKGYKYCLTIIDRYTRWPEVIPTEDMLAETTARALLNGWISRFGTPVTITTDQVTNFESSLMRELTNRMSSHRIHSVSYHPQSNEMIERFHRHLKSAIIAHEDAGWTDILPIVLLGLRSAMKNDLKATSSQLVYGTTLRLPSDLISSESLQTSVTPTYVSKLISMMRKLSPIFPDYHSSTTSYVHQSLSTCTHVFLRNDKIRPPLTPPYTGPHLVKSRSDKNFVICINNKNVTVTIDRCKPAFEFSEDFNPQKGSLNFEPPLTMQQIEDKTVVDKNIRTTRSGRHVHFPKRLTY
ncbi:hypothetical protein TNCV_2580621 [Trichonephila clavipes]|nr:hypothetical protein TNCV_2580621 [Trichonephila clavipes]